MAMEAAWQRGFPFVDLGATEIARLIQPYRGRADVVSAIPLEGGLRNSNYLVRLSNVREPVVLRVFSAEGIATPSRM